MEEQTHQDKKISSELQRRRGRPKKFNIMSSSSNNNNNIDSVNNNNNNNNSNHVGDVGIDEDKKIRALDDIEDAKYVDAQAEEYTSRGGGREAVSVGEVTRKSRTTVIKATPASRRRKSNPRRSPLV